METKIEQGRGNRNKQYWTATFVWPRGENHFCFRGKRDWMPKHNELATIIETVLAIEPPDKREFLRRKFAKALVRGFEAPVEHNGREEFEREAKRAAQLAAIQGEDDEPSDEEEIKKIAPANLMCDLSQ